MFFHPAALTRSGIPFSGGNKKTGDMGKNRYHFVRFFGGTWDGAFCEIESYERIMELKIFV